MPLNEMNYHQIIISLFYFLVCCWCSLFVWNEHKQKYDAFLYVCYQKESRENYKRKD